jgi:cation diffusion facilitator family transporter
MKTLDIESCKKEETKEKQRVALSSLIAAFFLTGSKLVVGIMTGSLGIISEALHSGLDLFAALITYITMRIVDKPPDETHHYGHGKAENIAAFTEALLLIFCSIWIIHEAIERFIKHEVEVKANVWAFSVIIVSIIIDISRAKALSKTAHKYDSHALEADALHFSSDVLSSIVVIIGLVFVSFGYIMADLIAAVSVAVFVGIASIKLANKTLSDLIDRVPEELEKNVQDAIKSVSSVANFHKLRIRKSGKQVFIDVHIRVNPDMSFVKVHNITDILQDRIKLLGYNTDVTIHAEPLKSTCD